MKIDIYMSELCGSYHKLRENLDHALIELQVPAEVEYHTVYYEDAIRHNIMGSPSIWINGADAFPSNMPPGIL